jgi:threonine dehydratase
MARIDVGDIRQAAKRIEGQVHHTPVMTCQTLNRISGAQIFFKCENLQKVGAFKMRGASNAIFSLTDEQASKGVCTHSSGNHVQAIALAAKMQGIQAYVVMPENAPRIKKNAVAGYGAEIIFCEPTLQARERTLEGVVKETGANFVHAYNDLRTIAGQGTVGLELCEQVSGLDIFMTPVGGGGLISGTSIAAKALCPQAKIIGAEPQWSDEAKRSLASGKIEPILRTDTIADGLRTMLGELTFEIITENVDEILTASEETIVEAMKLIWERMKIVVEPSGAVPLAAILENKDKFAGKKVGMVLSGGNVDLSKLPF